MSRRSWLPGVVIGAFIGTVLAGCGQTGPLYLPDDEPEVVSPTTESSTADPDAERKREEARLPAPQ